MTSGPHDKPKAHKPASKRAKGKDAQRPVRVIAIAGGVVALLALVAVVVTVAGSGSDTDPGTDADAGTEVQPVSVDGHNLPPLGNDGTDPGIGQAAPRVEGRGFDGTPVVVGGSTGRPQLIFFVAHWCPHCQKEVPVIVEWLDDKGSPEGVDLRGVSTGVQTNAPNYPPSRWLSRERWTIPTLVDDANSRAAETFGLSAYPFFVALDVQGKVVARTSGELTVAQIEDLVARAKRQ